MQRLISPIVVLALAGHALAVGTSHWVHSSESDFKKGTLRNVVVTSLGDIKLSRAVTTLLEQDPRISAVYSLAEGPDGAMYAGTGPHGIVLRINEGKSQPIYQHEGVANVFCLHIDPEGRLLLGIGGDKGVLLRIDRPSDPKPAAVEVFSPDDVQYIWAIARTSNGILYLGTGPSGKIFELTPDGKHSVLLDTDENNILSLISDGKSTLYAGTDPNGLIYRIDCTTRRAFVLYDAPEDEITALALDRAGNLYAATGESSEKPAGAAEPAVKEKAGRPEGTGGVPIPAKPPEMPKPPPLPDPNPGEPSPIPKGASLMMGEGWSRILKTLEDEPEPSPFPAPQPPKPPPGKPAPGKPAPQNAQQQPNTPQAAAPETPDLAKPKPEGNAIYRIDTDGFVREIFRQNVLVYSIVERGGTLMVATGSEGLVYEVDPAAEETSVLAKVEPKQVLSLLSLRDGRILLGMANEGQVAAMTSGFAPEGSFTSAVLDANQISRFGKIHLNGSLPSGAALSVATRSGNVQDPQHAGWSPWSAEIPATAFVQNPAPSARFLQYRLTLKKNKAEQTPVVEEIDLAYQMPNLPPVIKSLRVGGETKTAALPNAAAANVADTVIAPAVVAAPPAPPKPTSRNPVETITWEAEDANGDALSYSLYYRSGSAAPWIALKDKLTDTHWDWDTRGVPDGRYEIRVVASDAAANPAGQGKTGARISEAVIVDNTPPVIGDIKAKTRGGSISVRAKLVDQTTTVAAMEYSLDSGGDWQAVLPSDNIFDSPEETVDFVIPRVAPGAHQITLRATDAKGNTGYQSVMVTVAAEAQKK